MACHLSGSGQFTERMVHSREDIAVGDADIELEINAMIYSVGVGYRF